MSTILCKTLARSQPTPKVWYLKPISTGPLEEADDRHISRFSPEANTRCLFQFDEAVSPHIAARSKPVRLHLFRVANTDHKTAPTRLRSLGQRSEIPDGMLSV